MKRLSAMFSAVLLAGFLLLGSSPDAQAPTAGPGAVQSVSINANGDTGQFSLYQATGGAIQFSGTFVGTVQFEATINGTTWNALSVTPTAGGAAVTSATATGAWTFSNPGYSNVRVRASAWTSGNLIAQVTTVGPAGSVSLTGVSIPSDTATITMGSALDTVLCRGAANVIGIGGCTSSFPAIKRNGQQIDIRLADDSTGTSLSASSMFVTTTIGLGASGTTLITKTAPTISSGFGTSPSIVNNNGPSAFTLNVGTGGAATSGVVGLPTATTGWSCFANDRTNNTVTRQTATTTTTATFTAAAAWAASDILNISCFGY
jgi:hypothetical protein